MKFEYEDGVVIEKPAEKSLTFTHAGKSLAFDETGKPKFVYDTGEEVVEFSGIAVGDTHDESLAIARYRPLSASNLHEHHHHVEDYYILAGKAKVMVDGKAHMLSPGETITIQSNQVHRVINPSEDEPLMLFVKCMPAWVPEDYHLV